MVVDDFTHEAVLIEMDSVLSGWKIGIALNRVAQARPYFQAITVDDGVEVAGKELDTWLVGGRRN